MNYRGEDSSGIINAMEPTAYRNLDHVIITVPDPEIAKTREKHL